MTEKLIGIASVLAIVGGLFVATYFRGQSVGREKCQAEMQARVDEANRNTANTEAKSDSNIKSIRSEYETIIATKDNLYRDAVARIGPVRLPARPGSGQLSAATGTTAGDHGAAGRDGLLGPAGSDPQRDIGPDLARLTQLADVQTQRLLACQKYAAEIDRFRKQITR